MISFPSVPYLNHLLVPFSSLLLALRMQPSDRFFAQDYTFFAHQFSSLVSPISFFGPKKRPGMTTHLEWFQGTVQYLCGTYSRAICKSYPTDFGTHTPCRFLTKLCDQVVALISDQHSERLVFDNDTEHVDVDINPNAVDDSDRLFHFEVQQTRQQEDSARASKGFKVISMNHRKAISDCS